MDFVFGTLATDALKLVHHRVARRGVQHNHDLYPLDPAPGDPVTITVRTGPDLSIDRVACYYTIDGTPPHGARGQATNGEVLSLVCVDLVWDTLSWGYIRIWQGTLPGLMRDSIMRYRIGVWKDESEGAEIFADWPEHKAATERAAAAFFRGEPLPPDEAPLPGTGTTFAYSVDTFEPPQWARDAVIYQVFVDRFYPGDGKEWLEPDNLSGFYGGTLWGVRDKLNYLTDLGITCIWLSPTFPSPTHHGYDITDFYRVEPRMGGDEAMHSLIEAAHARGITVILDLVCNHISDQHPYFIDARQNPNSPYRDWFIFDDSTIGYKTFFDVPSMPYLNLRNPATVSWMLDITRYWLTRFNVDGFRLVQRQD